MQTSKKCDFYITKKTKIQAFKQCRKLNLWKKLTFTYYATVLCWQLQNILLLKFQKLIIIDTVLKELYHNEYIDENKKQS